MPEVSMPNGDVVNFPDDMPKEQIKGLISSKFPEVNDPDYLKMGKGIKEGVKQGFTFGLNDEAQAGIAAGSVGLQNLIGRDTGLTAGEAYDQALGDFRDQSKIAKNQAPGSFITGEILGALTSGTGLAKAAPAIMKGSTGGTALQGALSGGLRNAGAGAVSGGLYGFGTGEGGASSRLGNAALVGSMGAGIGGAAGAVTGALSNSLANRAARLLEIKRAAQNPTPPPMAGSAVPIGNQPNAVNRILEKLRKDYPDEAQFQQVLQKLKSGEVTLAELGGEATKDLALGAAQYPSGKAVMTEFFDGIPTEAGAAPQGGAIQSARQNITKSIEKNISGNKDYLGTLDDVYKSGVKRAQPFYEKAFKGGSIAPLETQYKNEWVKAGAERTAALKEVAAAEQSMTLSAAKKQAAGNNVYGNSSANTATKEATNKLEIAKAKLADASTRQNNALEMMKAAQSDATDNVPGAIWSPRINQFLEQPELKTGIQKGLKIQRLESVAQGKKFNPAEFAITGVDDIGEPIVSKTPNMRLLDAGKRGLDAMISEQTDPVTGRVTELGRALIQTKESYVKELKNLNPDYQAALDSAGDYFSMSGAMKSGKEFKGNAKQIAREFGKLKGQDKEAYLIGVVDNIRTMADKVRDNGNAYSKIFGTPETRAKLKAVLPEAQFKQLSDDLWASDRIYSLRNKVLGNSTTASKQLSAQEFASPDNAVIQSIAQGRPIAAGVAGATQWIKKAFDGISDKDAGEVARILTAKDETAKLKIIRQIADKIDPKAAAKTLPESKQLQLYFEIQDMAKPFRGSLAGSAGAIASQPLQIRVGTQPVEKE